MDSPKTEMNMQQLAELVTANMLNQDSKFSVLESSSLALAAGLHQSSLNTAQTQLLRSKLRNRGMELIPSRTHMNQFVLVNMRDTELSPRLTLAQIKFGHDAPCKFVSKFSEPGG